MMKSLFLLFTLGLSVFSYAQDGIVIHVDGQTSDISGATHTVVAPSNASFDIALDVENNTGSAHAWRVTRLRIDAPSGWTDALCWGHATDPFGGTCYSSGQMNTNPWTSPGAQSVLFTNDITILPGTPQDLRTSLTFAGCNQDSSLGERA